MSITPSEIIKLASTLIAPIEGKTLEEAVLRCSTSRAYYAALHAASESLPNDLAVTASDKKGKSSHQAVIDAIVLWSKSLRPGRTDAISVARNLPKLRNARKKADYSVGEDFTVEEAKATLRIASLTIDSARRAAQMALEKQA